VLIAAGSAGSLCANGTLDGPDAGKRQMRVYGL
jgi:hypothetical protein